MYTYIAQDIHGNWFVSKQSFPLCEAAEAEAYSVAEYDFITSIEIVRCEDMVCFNEMNPILN